MGLESLQIIFDNPDAKFSPGQSITGRVLILTSSFVRIRSVKLTFKGKATVSWYEKESRRNSDGETEDTSVKYHAKEQYFKNKTNLEDTSYLAVGEHIYPFNYSLPHQLPSTIASKHGSVRYEAKVKIDIPRGINKKTKRSFEVMSTINLNSYSSLGKPKKNETEKFYCCCCCKSGPMTMVVCVPYSGFIPGQIIPFTVEMDNNSNVEIDTIIVQLQRILKFHATHPSGLTKSCSSVVTVLVLEGVKQYSSKTNTREMIVPKSLTFSDLKHCGIISEDFKLNVVAHANGMHMKTEVNLKLTMGHIPLSGLQVVPEYGCPTQSLDQNNRSNEPFFANAVQPFGFNKPAPVPGLAHQVPPYGSQSLVPAYPHQSLYPAQIPCGQPEFNQSQTLLNSQSQVSYPINPAVNPYAFYNDSIPGAVSPTPTAPYL